MSGDTAKITLRQLMTMSGGFRDEMPSGGFIWADAGRPGKSYTDLILQRRPNSEPGSSFGYSNPSAHLAAAVLAAALTRADAGRARNVLEYAREKLFELLGISSHPAFSEPLPDLLAPEFVSAAFGWGTDPNGIHNGAVGLRLTAPDMLKLGELYRENGVWNGQQVVPRSWVEQSIRPSTRNPQPRLRPALVDPR